MNTVYEDKCVDQKQHASEVLYSSVDRPMCTSLTKPKNKNKITWAQPQEFAQRKIQMPVKNALVRELISSVLVTL